MQQQDDIQLIIKIGKGDSKSFESLMLKYQKLIFGYCMKMLKNKQKAEDIYQETWLRVVQNAHQYSPIGSVKSWILSICRHLIIDEFRKEKKWVHLEDEQWSQIEDSESDLLKFFEQNQKKEKLHQAFENLPEHQKMILGMLLIEECSQSEISIKLGLSVGSVKAALFRARENLKSAVGESR